MRTETINNWRLRAKVLSRSAVALVGNAPLPPGSLQRIDQHEKLDRDHLLRLQSSHGPILKGIDENGLLICVFGLTRGRQLLQEHCNSLQPISLRLEQLFEHGFLRTMQGDVHKNYRTKLNGALKQLSASHLRAEFEHDIQLQLRNYASSSKPNPQTFLASLNEIATRFLLRYFFGAKANSEMQRQLLSEFHQLGPHGLVWNIQKAQREAFANLCAILREHNIEQDCVLKRVEEAGPCDDTMLGNLIYMVEMGRYDLRGLLRWLTRYAAVSLQLDLPNSSPTEQQAQALVQEVLRVEQSERLMRTCTQDFVFEKFLFPKGASVRICMWEAHRNPKSFEDPFSFNAERFLTRTPEPDEFSPFGIDQHRCPLARLVSETGVIFLTTLLADFQIVNCADGPAQRGAYHWEPPANYHARLEPKHSMQTG